jgi:hypothetical protein
MVGPLWPETDESPSPTHVRYQMTNGYQLHRRQCLRRPRVRSYVRGGLHGCAFRGRSAPTDSPQPSRGGRLVMPPRRLGDLPAPRSAPPSALNADVRRLRQPVACSTKATANASLECTPVLESSLQGPSPAAGASTSTACRGTACSIALVAAPP